MKTILRSALVSAVFLTLAVSPSIRAQKHTAANGQAASLEDRRKALDTVFHDYWEDVLKSDPEYASFLGDKRYNDKLSDYSVKSVNDQLAREQGFLMRLAAVDPIGLSGQENTSREMLLNKITEDLEAADFKEWEMPVNQMGGIYDDFPIWPRNSALPRLRTTTTGLRASMPCQPPLNR